MSNQLKLMALDAEDLTVVSTYIQDAVLKSADIEYDVVHGVLILPMNRFVWEAKSAQRLFFKKFERRLSVLRFSRVTHLKSRGIFKQDPEQVLALMAMSFVADGPDNPSGTLNLTFSENADMALNVECIEVQMSDLKAAWSASGKPRHPV